MEEIDIILGYTKRFKADLWGQCVELQRLINGHRITKVFTNVSDEGFVANYIKYVKGKVCLNSIDDKHFKDFGGYDNCTYTNSILEKVNIRKGYDLIHLDTAQEFNFWDLFISRIIRNNPKFIVLSNTKKLPQQTNEVMKNIFKKHYHIDTTFDDYKGTIILKYMS
jgi:hypothetical protein